MSVSRRDEVAVWALALGQMLGYACFFYSFAALVIVWQRELSWGHGVLAMGPLLSIGMTAVLSPQVGRWVDRGYALRLMGWGTGLGAASLALLAMAWHPLVYLLAFAGLGAAASATLYEVCFALLIRRFAEAARGPITKVTLVAGLASTLAFPAGAALSSAYGWRMAVWIAVAVVICVMLPLQVWGARTLGGGRVKGHKRPAPAAAWRVILSRPGVIRLMAVFALLNLNHWMLVSLMRPLLAEMGQSDGRAVMVAALIGPSQVVGRIVLMVTGARLRTGPAAVFTGAAMIAGPLMLLLSGAGPVFVFGFSMVQGAAMGVFTILRPLMVSEVNGPDDYAASAAAISLPAMISTAIAPLLGTWIIGMGGPMTLVGSALALSVAAMVLILQRKPAA